MLKKNRKYIFTLAFCFLIVVMFETLSPKPVDWRPSYQRSADIPTGMSALYELLPYVFPGQEINVRTVPAYNVLSDTSLMHCNYIFVNESFDPDKLDTRELLRFAEKGNNIFVSASAFGKAIADTLGFSTGSFIPSFTSGMNDTASIANYYLSKDSAAVNFSNPFLRRDRPFVFYKGFANGSFSSFDTLHSTVLGTNNHGEVNFIRVGFGKGSIFLNTVPEAFTNYHFTSNDNSEYAFRALSALPIQEVLWDEYYKAGSTRKESPIRVILNNAPLRSAFLLLIFSLLLFMVVGIKRRQRAIPELEPVRNTTLQFVDVVGSLYFQTGDHKNIADKKITYFLEYIRTAFQVQTLSFDDVFILRVSRLSGIPEERITELFNYIGAISLQTRVSQQELLKLNKMIEEFHLKNKR